MRLEFVPRSIGLVVGSLLVFARITALAAEPADSAAAEPTVPSSPTEPAAEPSSSSMPNSVQPSSTPTEPSATLTSPTTGSPVVPASALTEHSSSALANTSRSLRVAVALTIADASLISEWILARNSRIDEQMPAVDGHEQWVEVKISGGTYDYDVLVRAMHDGIALESTGKLAHCECNSEKLLELVDERIATAVEQLKEVSARAREPDPEPEAPSTAVSLAPEQRSFSRLGIGGIVTTVLGTGLVGGGLVVMLEDPPVFYFPTYGRNWDPPGVAALAVGGAAVAAGVSMVVVDVLQCRRFEAPRRCERRGRRKKQLTLDVGPSLEAGGGGLAIFGRF